jgi:hypothetical protein
MRMRSAQLRPRPSTPVPQKGSNGASSSIIEGCVARRRRPRSSHVEGKNRMVDACAYHPAGSVIVAIVTTGEELAPGAPAEDFGSDSVKTLAVGLDIAAARNLLDFLGQK